MAVDDDLEQSARRVLAALNSGKGLSVETQQALFTAGVVGFAARRLDGQSGSPFSPGHSATATDVALTAAAMLEDANIAIFELGLWQSMGGGKKT